MLCSEKRPDRKLLLNTASARRFEAVVQMVMFICFCPLPRARHRRGDVGGAFVTRRQRFPRRRLRRCRKAPTPPFPPADASRPLFSL